MNKIINYYNQSRHETLIQTLFSAYPELKKVYKFISPWVMEYNELDLETKYVKECVKYNYYIKSKPDYKPNNENDIKIHVNQEALKKRRAKLSKDNYKIVNEVGNIFQLENMRTNEKIFKPRHQIKPSPFKDSARLRSPRAADFEDVLKYFYSY